jgi:hypothetical protein
MYLIRFLLLAGFIYKELPNDVQCALGVISQITKADDGRDVYKAMRRSLAALFVDTVVFLCLWELSLLFVIGML